MSQEPANMNMNPFDTVETDDNVIQPFQLDVSSLRGRTVRLGAVLEDILAPHDYPEPIAQLVAETTILALLLSSMLKFEGIFTLQMKGDAAVKLLVADVTSAGHVRACATFDSARLAASDGSFSALLGHGYCAFTVDQTREGTTTPERYQGIVELTGESLVSCVQHYFKQSEQIPTAIKVSVGRGAAGAWRGGGILLQKMPEEGGLADAVPLTGHEAEDDWQRAMVLLGSCTAEELLAPDLHSNVLLVRLFHEEHVRVFAPLPVIKQCRCSEDKVQNIIDTMDNEELTELAQDGKISMRCEFCSHEYVRGLEDILKSRNFDA